jgi:hypothetical protein
MRNLLMFAVPEVTASATAPLEVMVCRFEPVVDV